ncbi:hypothetical protein EPA93_35615 [Ktedonosporobacter rubrisoli]|uniref:Uncharacterized protein n=1 Tax=Ktedonosporobacter rubrisoli TaxID=2509675 RepID=A0A4P6JZS4_KTERU|nr:hypothetical protein [Ktedonosporobacter rubrisoli]QBD81013.1 hypothetical protein EPA93_35615 [Ktedonosporobacter rubrisoli]
MSEIAEIRRRIEENYEAAWRALYAPAVVAPHKFITRKLIQVESGYAELMKHEVKSRPTRRF